MKCFYHSADLDGHCSGALVKNEFPDCEMIPFNYGNVFPWACVENEEVIFMVDCSLPILDMVKLNSVCSLRWIDHHETIINDAALAGFSPAGIREVGRAGCELVWEYLFYGTEHEHFVPQAVHYLGRYDVWDHTDPDTLPFQYGMRLHETHPNDPENMYLWEELFKSNAKNKITNGALTRKLVLNGTTILAYEKVQNKKKCDSMAFDSRFIVMPDNTLNALCCNLGMVNSQLFDSMWDEEKYDLMIAFCRRDLIWNVSLYSTKEGINCGALAQLYGGGGHAKAAGFSCDELPLTDW